MTFEDLMDKLEEVEITVDKVMVVTPDGTFSVIDVDVEHNNLILKAE